MSQTTLFADIILPLFVPKAYTYRIPAGWESHCKAGQRVVVQFGKTKLYTGIIRSLHHDPPKNYQAKYIENILDEHAIVTQQQFELWDWISSYYMCYPGEVFNVALPGNLKLNSETRFYLDPGIEEFTGDFSDNELALMEALQAKPGMTSVEIAELIKLKHVQPFLKKLVERKIITSEEEIHTRYKPKLETYIYLHPDFHNETVLGETLTKLEKKAPKQVDALMAYLKIGLEGKKYAVVKKEDLLRLIPEGENGLQALIKKEILVAEKVKVDRHTAFEGTVEGFKKLSEAQEKALNEIKAAFEHHAICLLHGVTASGKTEIYFKLIQETIAQGKQVLFLLPEIAITAQMVDRMNRAFGDVVGIYHSRFNPNERVDVWMKTLEGPSTGYKIIVGARSAVFLPFNNLGLVIVDEEHEQSFKQQHPSPRYNGRDTAIVLAQQFGCKILLGSATPAVETYSNAVNKKYGYVQLMNRFSKDVFPEIVLVDIKEEKKKKALRENFSERLIQEIDVCLKNRQQVIVFQNRRGYTPLWICADCGWIPQCTQCNVSLTYHKFSHQLVCHYCNSKYKPHNRCNACGSSKLQMVGLGTEKIEETIQLLLPEAKTGRMDFDTTRSKNAYRQIIDDFESGKINVLVGTQMVTKGLDFSNVGLVVVPSADSILHYPEFRAFERAFQLFTQVAGRAGRKENRGKVLIQTSDVKHHVIQLVQQHDFNLFYEYELRERKKYFYPPFARIIELELSHRDEDHLNKASLYLAGILRERLGKRLLGPEKPVVNKVMNQYIEKMMIKIEKTPEFADFKQFLSDRIDEFRMFSDYKNVRVLIDVDPM